MTRGHRHASRTFPVDERSVGEARRHARESLDTWDVVDVADDVVLLVSELMTNAVTHAGTSATLNLGVDEFEVRVEVEDSHPGRRLSLAGPPEDPLAEFGRGLDITASLASTWGVDYRQDSKRVWATVTLHDDPLPSPGEPTPGPKPEARPGTIPERAAPVPVRESNPLGLSDAALTRLSLDDFLVLAVEQVRDRVAADAAYLLMAQDLDERFRVQSVTGLPSSLVGRVVERGAPGTSSGRSPVSIDDLARTPVAILAETDLQSLVVAPVLFEGRMIGALAAASNHVDGFGEEQSVLLQRAADWIAAAVDRGRSRHAEQQRGAWLGFLAEAGDLLAGPLDPEMTVALTGQIVVPELARWCGIFLDDERGRPILAQVWHEDEQAVEPLRQALANAGGAVESGDLQLDGEVRVLPLRARGRRIGLLALGRPEGDPLRGELSSMADSVSLRAALAIDNARAHAELHAAGLALQRSLLPAALLDMPGVDIGVVYEPAGEGDAAGGDFYDLFPVGNGRWCFMVGDVCGKGAEAAALTGMARHSVRALMRAGFSIASTLERLNAAILEEGELARFVTLACGTLQPTDGGRMLLRLVCAGHPPPFLVGEGEVRRLGRPQPLLGVVDAVAYVDEEYILGRGDLLVTLTDGVLERRNGAIMLDDEGVVLELDAARSLSAQAVADRLRRTVVEFAPEPHRDDLAVLALRIGTAPG
jgi:serine phosphatase RsbU (regulator of sigma subunit)/anti-sigma regulatory factor (Ser/Thr protein kinase)